MAKGDIQIPDNVLVIGGGDVAMDTVTTLKLLGVKEVTDVVYETFAEFKASKKELQGAQKLGVSILDGYVPTKVEGNTVYFKHRTKESELSVKADLIILAVGQCTELGNISEITLTKGEGQRPRQSLRGRGYRPRRKDGRLCRPFGQTGRQRHRDVSGGQII
jgi:dihydropyrimidine dehydrogenase (NAD+) subunit PreT